MNKEYFKIEKTIFPNCKEEVIFSPNLNIVMGDHNSHMHAHASYLSSLDENDEICIWSDSNAYILHPTQLKIDAGYLIQGVSRGLQGIIFTDSLFFVKELEILARQKKLEVKYFNLYFKNDVLEVEESNDMYSLSHFSLLKELISQFERETDLCDLSFLE